MISRSGGRLVVGSVAEVNFPGTGGLGICWFSGNWISEDGLGFVPRGEFWLVGAAD